MGYVCLPTEQGSQLYYVLTKAQGILNMANFVAYSAIMVTSYLITWWLMKITVQRARKMDDDGVPINVEQVEIQRKSLLKAIALIFVCYVVLCIPLFISAGSHEIESISPWLGTCLILYEMHFCTNFIIYAILVADYREAFLDVLYIMCPCCFKWPRNLNNEEIELQGY